MSDIPAVPTFERSRFFHPVGFLLGFAAALVACSAIARVAAHRGYHTTFTRFHVVLSPQAQYYPTIEEMCGLVRSRCRPDQVLVIVGGNSIFEGVGQPADKLWTAELRRLLGPRYCVANLAFAGSLCTDGGAPVAEALRTEFPRQIYVANSSPFSTPVPYGIEPYRYLIWEARSLDLLEHYRPREAYVDNFMNRAFAQKVAEMKESGWLDRALRFRDFWNWIGYEYLFTVPNPITPDWPRSVWARKRFPDNEPDFEQTPVAERKRRLDNEAEMKIVRAFSGHFYEKDPKGEWRPISQLRDEFMEAAKAAFPDDLKARTLIMLSRNNPYFLRQLSADELRREDAAYRDGAAAWREAGYRSADYGRDFNEADFGDRTHLAASGGRKLAAVVAEQVRSMAGSLGYLKGEKPR
jgi:hypothetical protein